MTAARRHAGEMEQQARMRGYALDEATAARILTAVAAAESGFPPPPACYPRLIWVFRQD